MGRHTIEQAAVVGAGTMGQGIAQVLAAGGIPVRISDRTPALAGQGKEAVAQSLNLLSSAGYLAPSRVPEILDAISVCADIETSVDGVGFVVEAVPEDLSAKQAVLRRISDSASGEAIFATNTSSFDINVLASSVHDPRRFLGTHWYNPAHLIPCVEVVRSEWTDGEILVLLVELLRSFGKEPVEVASTAGFVGNRLQFAMVAEAFRCLEEGVAGAEDIDGVVRSSFGLRPADFGPMRLADLGGLDTYLAILRYLSQQLGDRFRPPAALVKLVEAGRTGVKSGAGIFDYDGDDARVLIADRDLRLAARTLGSSSTARDDGSSTS